MAVMEMIIAVSAPERLIFDASKVGEEVDTGPSARTTEDVVIGSAPT